MKKNFIANLNKTTSDKYGNRFLKIKLKDIFEKIPGNWKNDLEESIKESKHVIWQFTKDVDESLPVADVELKPLDKNLINGKINKLVKWNLNRVLKFDVSVPWEAENELSLVSKGVKKIKKNNEINSFEEIISWNYKKRGFLYLHNEIFNCLKNSPFQKGDLYIECSKGTNYETKYYVCFMCV